MTIEIENITGREPLADYPWRSEVDRLLDWFSLVPYIVLCLLA